MEPIAIGGERTAPPPRPPYDLAVDRHHRTLAVVCATRAGEELWCQRFPANARGEEALRRRLQPGDRVVIEATGGVHRLANFLESSGAEVIVADALQAHLVGARGKKSDFRDGRALLSHLRTGGIVAVWRPDAATREVRHLTRERFCYNQMIVRLKNRLRALLWEEGFAYPGDLWGEAGTAWLSSLELPAATRRILERERLVLKTASQLKDLQEKELAQRAVGSSAAQRLMQIVGFGAAAAVMCLGEIGAIGRFQGEKQLVSYAGLDPSVHDSDGVSRGGPIAKAGRSQLRWLLVEVAWSHVLHHGPAAQRYHRLVKRGKPAGVAIVALARHLLVVAYHLLTSEEPYRELNESRYEQKLARLGSHREWSEEPQATNLDWAAGQFQAMTGSVSPYRQSHPEAGKRRRHRPPGARACRGQSGGGEPSAAVGRSEFPAQGKSDPSERPTAAHLAA